MNILMKETNNSYNQIAAVDYTIASVSPIFSNKEAMTPIFDRSDTGPLHAPIKKTKKTKKIKEEVLDPVKKNMGHIFNFILEDMKKRENMKNDRAYTSSDISSDSEEEYDVEEDVFSSDSEDDDSNYDYENPEGNEYFTGNFDSDGEFDESDDMYEYGICYKV
jgi:hypothetical protein